MKHASGPWRKGETLDTDQTRRWSQAERDMNDEREATQVFAYFTEEDQGRSRQLICSMNVGLPNWEANRDLVAGAPVMATLIKLALSHNNVLDYLCKGQCMCDRDVGHICVTCSLGSVRSMLQAALLDAGVAPPEAGEAGEGTAQAADEADPAADEAEDIRRWR